MLIAQSDILKLVEVARMYYEQELTQSEIAQKLGVSRPLISKILQRAKELGIVTIQINSPMEGNEGLLHRLKIKFNLVDGLVVPANRNHSEISVKNYVSQAGLYLSRKIADSKAIGIGWGGVIAEIIDEMENLQVRGEDTTTICPLLGSMASPSKGYHPNELARKFAEYSQGEAAYLHAPAFPGSKKNYEVFKQTDEYKSIESLWQRLDMALVSVGAYPSVPDQATAMRFGKTLREKHAVGTMLSYYYDAQGTIIEGQNDYVVHIPLEFLKKINKVVAISFGNMNGNSLLGALRTGLVTHVITDDIEAKQVLELDSEK